MITLATLAQATAQEVFDQVKTHLLTQNKRSLMDLTESANCAYRSPDGLKCAAGCLIADNEYNPSIEGKAWMVVPEYLGYHSYHFVLISNLQRLHDFSEPTRWPEELKQVAINHDLLYEHE